ncbi:MAG: DUF1015 family protein [Patescibacteria group bacterium]|nr:DUF1015 family protein [Patescibacteria group bacterium]MDD4304337.1 DUF1015 family protein [Patescibacteria group bacterium]MDD4695600.1 DUF1015 family protein [Patescibacteria group bacterium]
MATIKAFKGLRPKLELVKEFSAPPYDVLNSDEAREYVKDKPNSFLHVTKPEVDLEKDIDLYDDRVYVKAKENFQKMVSDGIFVLDDKPCLYIYRLVMGNIDETGIVACSSVSDYENNIIKKHEKTRADKEADRIRHTDTINANAGPVFLTYKAREDINEIVNSFMQDNSPVYDFVADNGVANSFWKISDDAIIAKIVNIFSRIDYTYIADGHHRAASGALVGKQRREANPNHRGDEEYNFFLSVLFPHNHLYIMDYNRIVKDLNGLNKEEFLVNVKEKFEVEEFSKENSYKPESIHTFGMYLDHTWYKISTKEGTYDKNDVIKSLDVSILQDNLLNPILGIEDPRKDKRIDFVGGIRGLDELKNRVDNGEAVAFSMFPTSIEELMNIADAGEIMPPKSTWFEPKLRSGMVIHLY